MITEAQLSDLPGGEEILKGLEDLSCGTLSIEACLAECCSPKLIQYGLADVSQTGRIVEPELEMYRLLAETDGEEAFVRYSSLLRRISSFGRALEHRAEIRSREANQGANGHRRP